MGCFWAIRGELSVASVSLVLIEGMLPAGTAAECPAGEALTGFNIAVGLLPTLPAEIVFNRDIFIHYLTQQLLCHYLGGGFLINDKCLLILDLWLLKEHRLFKSALCWFVPADKFSYCEERISGFFGGMEDVKKTFECIGF